MLLISITVLRAKVQLLRHEVFSCLKHLNKEKNREKVLRNTIPDQAQEELDIFVGKDRNVQEAGIKNLRYLQAVVKETLRMYAPSPILLRAAKDDCTLSNGYHVAAGTSLMLNIWKIQCDERVWSDPNEFQPERFLTSHKDTDVWGLNFEMIPFGSRRRSCPGVSLALQMLNLTMASLLHSFEG
ncbi:hypothetical protein WN943_021387 [Citrus x changshan-huyou]